MLVPILYMMLRNHLVIDVIVYQHMLLYEWLRPAETNQIYFV